MLGCLLCIGSSVRVQVSGLMMEVESTAMMLCVEEAATSGVVGLFAVGGPAGISTAVRRVTTFASGVNRRSLTNPCNASSSRCGGLTMRECPRRSPQAWYDVHFTWRIANPRRRKCRVRYHRASTNVTFLAVNAWHRPTSASARGSRQAGQSARWARPGGMCEPGAGAAGQSNAFAGRDVDQLLVPSACLHDTPSSAPHPLCHAARAPSAWSSLGSCCCPCALSRPLADPSPTTLARACPAANTLRRTFHPSTSRG